MNQFNKKKSYLAGLISGLFFLACPEVQRPEPPQKVFAQSTEDLTYTGGGSEYTFIENSQDTEFTINLDLGTNTKDVLFILTNTNYNINAEPYPINGSVSSASRKLQERAEPVNFSSADTALPSSYRPTTFDSAQHPLMQRVAEYNSTVDLSYAPLSLNRSLDFVQPRHASTLGNSETFYLADNNSETIDATLRHISSNGTFTFQLWVANDSWYAGGSKTNRMTQEMVDIAGEAFLRVGNNNDIFDWVSQIAGDPWGSSGNPFLIPNQTVINALFYDIDDDEATGQPGEVFTGGFFWSKDNLVRSQQPGSNERLMFYMDSVIFATDNGVDDDGLGGHWEVTDDLPNFIIGTLAHEYQHMIHFWEKRVKRGNFSGTWFNEMCSMLVEDLLADKIGANGPRGLPFDTYTAGPGFPPIIDGRLPLYTGFNFTSLFDWLEDNDVLISYAMSYSFGAFLIRNYGGPQLLRNMINSEGFDAEAIDDALNSAGYTDLGFQDVLHRWAVATYLSDDPGTNPGMRFNKGGAFTWTFDGTPYSTGSINFYNYRNSFLYDSVSNPFAAGPTVFTPAGHENKTPFDRASSRAILVGDNVTGEQSWTLKLDSGVRLAVVVR
jgi:hypothetical protein